MKKLGIIGCGYLGMTIAKAYVKGLLSDYEFVGAYSGSEEKREAFSAMTGANPVSSVDELIELKPDYIIETASVKAVKENALNILEHGISMVVISIGAFADKAFFEKIKETADKNNAKVHIASGAIGGYDVLQTIHVMSLAGMGEQKAELHNITSPEVFEKFDYFRKRLTTKTEDCEVFYDTAQHAIELLPGRVNVAVATGLASCGPEYAMSRQTSRPGVVGDYQHIKSGIEGYTADINVYSCRSDIAAWSMVALLRNLASPVQFQ
ncbi:MAG: aspartate dehydrogenase [Eubacteriales bacterium]|nr:aspartate dehydrogenase [Eubacteriales bacterium]